ncbi:cupredoxin domain-containing protein [Brevibacillus sp. H7]|uniref:cupredoxin domain-containing protein n=1 Tax=Brevibacillus sp. H7 TaxID=3349138 RepID=UPI00381264FC
MKKWGFILSTLVVSAVMLAGCGGESKPQATETSQSAPAASGNAINIEASNWKFNQDKFEVKAGEPVTINFKSAEGFHGITIEGLDVNIQKEGSKTITPDKPGEYQILCSIPCGPDHGKMAATLVVK